MRNLAAKEVTCQVRYMTDNANTINKNYTGLKSTITNDQIKALAQFFNQLTNDMVVSAWYKNFQNANIEWKLKKNSGDVKIAVFFVARIIAACCGLIIPIITFFSRWQHAFSSNYPCKSQVSSLQQQYTKHQ